MSMPSTGLSAMERRSSSVPGAKWDDYDSFTVEEVAKILRLSRDSAYEAAKNGDLPTIRIGRRLIVPRAALERMLTGRDDPTRAMA